MKHDFSSASKPVVQEVSAISYAQGSNLNLVQQQSKFKAVQRLSMLLDTEAVSFRHKNLNNVKLFSFLAKNEVSNSQVSNTVLRSADGQFLVEGKASAIRSPEQIQKFADVSLSHLGIDVYFLDMISAIALAEKKALELIVETEKHKNTIMEGLITISRISIKPGLFSLRYEIDYAVVTKEKKDFERAEKIVFYQEHAKEMLDSDSLFKARASLSKLRKLDPDGLETHMLWGAFYQKNYTLDPAYREYKKALEIDPQNIAILKILVELAEKTENNEEKLAFTNQINEIEQEVQVEKLESLLVAPPKGCSLVVYSDPSRPIAEAKQQKLDLYSLLFPLVEEKETFPIEDTDVDETPSETDVSKTEEETLPIEDTDADETPSEMDVPKAEEEINDSYFKIIYSDDKNNGREIICLAPSILKNSNEAINTEDVKKMRFDIQQYVKDVEQLTK